MAKPFPLVLSRLVVGSRFSPAQVFGILKLSLNLSSAIPSIPVCYSQYKLLFNLIIQDQLLIFTAEKSNI